MVRKINDHNKNKEKKLMEREEKKKAQEEKTEEKNNGKETPQKTVNEKIGEVELEYRDVKEISENQCLLFLREQLLQ